MEFLVYRLYKHDTVETGAILTVYNAVLLFFYREAPEWPTRLNEVYLYIHITLYFLCIGPPVYQRRERWSGEPGSRVKGANKRKTRYYPR